MADFINDVKELRARARENIDRGPVTDAYAADLPRVIAVLQTALATELICVLRYRQHHFAAKGLNSDPIAAEFLAHSQEEQEHADKIAVRLSQLGADPDLDPSTLVARAESEYRTADTLVEMITENLVAERIAVASYTQTIGWIGDGDPTTRRMLEEILAVEEEHAEDLSTYLSQLR